MFNGLPGEAGENVLLELKACSTTELGVYSDEDDQVLGGGVKSIHTQPKAVVALMGCVDDHEQPAHVIGTCTVLFPL
jgi:hypothetical protein